MEDPDIGESSVTIMVSDDIIDSLKMYCRGGENCCGREDNRLCDEGEGDCDHLVTSDVVKTTVFISQVDSGIILMTAVRSAAPLIDPVPRVRVCAQVMMSVRQLVTTTTA